MADGPVAFFSVRKAVWSVTVCGLVVATGLAAGPVRMELTGNPVPSAGQVQAAQNQVNKRAAALGKQEEQVAQANAKLTDLQNQAEILTQNYDKAMVDEQQAQTAYTTAVNKLAAARTAARSSQREVGALAANEYETEGGFDPMAAMLGDAHGIQAYLNQMGLGQVFTDNRTDILAKNNADSVVAGVFRSEASTALKQKKSAAAQAAKLKTQVQTAVAAQLTAVKQSQAVAGQLSGGLQSAKNHENHVANQRAQALAAAAAAAAAAAERARARSAASSASSAPSSYTGSAASSSQGDIAADFALSQMGKPYQWGAAGPSTYDCSGLAMVAWAHAGVSILHYTGDQWNEGTHVSRDELEPGDLVFFYADISHVGLYLGDGLMVDAPSFGQDVMVQKIDWGIFVGAVRVS